YLWFFHLRRSRRYPEEGLLGRFAVAWRKVMVASLSSAPLGGLAAQRCRPALAGRVKWCNKYCLSPLPGAQAQERRRGACNPPCKGGPTPLRGKPPQGG